MSRKKEYEEKETKETRKSRREKAKESKRKATIAIMITLIICSLIIFSIIFALLNIRNTNILSGISILNIDVSEMSKEEALQKIITEIDDLGYKKQINLQTSDVSRIFLCSFFLNNF